MTVSFLLYLFVGKVLLFFAMKFAEGNGITTGYIGRLLSCDLCGGFVIYGLLSLLMGEILFRDYYFVPIVSQIITGGISSLMVALIHSGYKSRFEVLVIE